MTSESVWVDGSFRPDGFIPESFDLFFAPGEPDGSGTCIYLSKSLEYLWKDTDCAEEHVPLCDPIYQNDCLCDGAFMSESENAMNSGDDVDKECSKFR